LATVKMSSVVEQEVWEEFKDLARESHQSISGLLTDALRDYLARKRVRPVVMSELEASMRENQRLGELLAE
jgi:predicted transcriptional regulator